jgi:hypothetical protein
LAEAFQGVGQLSLSPGSNRLPVQDQWKSMTLENLEYFDSKYKFEYTDNSLFDWILPGQANSFATYSYDALAAVAMAACNVSMNVAPQEGTFSGMHHANAIINGIPFQGTNGVVAFNPETATRQGTSVEFIITNVVKSTSDDDKMTQLTPFVSSILAPNLEGTDWTLLPMKPFVYFDGSTNAPADLHPLSGGCGREFNHIGTLCAMGFVLWSLVFN